MSKNVPTSTRSLIVAMPYTPSDTLEERLYKPEYVDYIASLLPTNEFDVKGYYVSLENIEQFLDDMLALHAEKKHLNVLNFCDGGEWDGHPGVSVARQWELHPVSKLVPTSGANAQFITNSDNKSLMNQLLGKSNLEALNQILLRSETIEKTDLAALVSANGLDTSWPLFCKLNIGGGAYGIDTSSICHDIESLQAQINKLHAFFKTNDLLIQPYLPGPEYTVLVLENRVYAAVRRDFHNKYNIMFEDYITDACPVEGTISYFAAPEEIKNLALKAVRSIPGKHHYTRVDMRDDGKGNIYVIDINDRPSFDKQSTIQHMLEFNGLNDAELLQEIVATSSTIRT